MQAHSCLLTTSCATHAESKQPDPDVTPFNVNNIDRDPGKADLHKGQDDRMNAPITGIAGIPGYEVEGGPPKEVHSIHQVDYEGIVHEDATR